MSWNILQKYLNFKCRGALGGGGGGGGFCHHFKGDQILRKAEIMYGGVNCMPRTKYRTFFHKWAKISDIAYFHLFGGPDWANFASYMYVSKFINAAAKTDTADTYLHIFTTKP